MIFSIYFLFCVNYVLCKPSVNQIVDEKDDVINPFTNKMARNKTQEEILRERTKHYWNTKALNALSEKLKQRMNFNKAKNVIFFLGDGLSIPTISATRVYMGGEEMSLSFEDFPYSGLSKTYCVDHQTPDSACSATAYLGGVKANLGTIGVTAAVKKHNCTATNIKENHVDSLAKLFQLKGRKTGLVTTTRVTHASPAAIYAHTANRHWETDTDVIKSKADLSECEDIAHQLIYGETGQRLNIILGLDVIIGGGRGNFLSENNIDEEGYPGKRTDSINLIEKWKEDKKNSGRKYEYIWNRSQLQQLGNNTEYVLGLFGPSHMNYNKERNVETEPSLEEMTATAIRVLKKDSKGFFLFVEGGRIDTAHHFSWAHKALDETAEFSKAINRAKELVNEEDTLIVVTSDHAHTMSYAGYAARGSNVFGYAGRDSDKNLYAILNYANGPGYKPLLADGSRYVPSPDEMNKIGFQWPATIPKAKETHGADDVAIFAKGPWSHLFTGVIEENVIPHLISFAACVHPGIECADVERKLA